MIPLLFFAAAAQFAGTWILEVDGRNCMALELDGRGGTMIRPKHFNVDGDGEVTNIHGELTRTVVKWTKKAGEFRAGDDVYRIEIVDPEHATLSPVDVPWLGLKLRRARPGEDVRLPAEWPKQEYAPEIVELQKRIQAMVDEDQAVRLKEKIAPAEMEQIDGKHRAEVEAIFAKHGWPKRSIAGREAANGFWLLVQHQPLELQQRMLPEMEAAMRQGEASRTDYAYLFDRVRIGEGKPQRWGTQAKCVNGLAVLSPVEDQAGLEARRRELHMPPVAEYLKRMKEFCRAMR